MRGLATDMVPLSLPQRSFPILPLIIGWLAKATGRVTLMKQEMLSFLMHIPVFVLFGFFRIIRVIKSFFLCVVFSRQFFVLFPFPVVFSDYPI